MIIYFNEVEESVSPDLSLHTLLVQKKYFNRHFAVSINNQLITRGQYEETYFDSGDKVDILVPMQGG
jgi:thiamine biosynthesis protein ThiS